MKSVNLIDCGLKPLSFKDQKKTNGGWIWFFNWTVYRPGTVDQSSLMV
jgi:hypothetical protein